MTHLVPGQPFGNEEKLLKRNVLIGGIVAYVQEEVVFCGMRKSMASWECCDWRDAGHSLSRAPLTYMHNHAYISFTHGNWNSP